MVAVNSGIAPSLSFAQERCKLGRAGHDFGRQLLFYGCHSMHKGFLYEIEWKVLSQDGHPKADAAESRAGETTAYVQDRFQR